MFCPQCRVEYRPGFTHCTDCDVDLVQESLLDPGVYPQVRKTELPGKLSCTLWRGKDPHFYLDLIGDLGSKKVPYFGTPVNPPLYDSFEQQPAGSYSAVEFEVLVSEENLAFARWVLSSVEELQREQEQEGAGDLSEAEEPDVSPDVVGICPFMFLAIHDDLFRLPELRRSFASAAKRLLRAESGEDALQASASAIPRRFADEVAKCGNSVQQRKLFPRPGHAAKRRVCAELGLRIGYKSFGAGSAILGIRSHRHFRPVPRSARALLAASGQEQRLVPGRSANPPLDGQQSERA